MHHASRPAYSVAAMDRSTAAPTPLPSLRTPATATDRGARRGASERDSARNSRRSAASWTCGVLVVCRFNDHDPAVGVLRELVPGVGEDLEHRVVLDEHLRLDPADPTVANQGEQVLEEQGAETLAVMGVRDQHGDLDRLGADRLGRRKTHQTPVGLGDQGEGVGLGQHVVHVAVSGRPRHVEEAHPQRVVGDLVVQRMYGGPVGRHQAPDDTDAAVGEHHVGQLQLTDHSHDPSLGGRARRGRVLGPAGGGRSGRGVLA